MLGQSVSPFIARSYDLFAGLDVDKKSISVTLLNHDGMIQSFKIPFKAEPLMTHVRQHFPDQRVAFAYEAGGTGFGLYDQLTAQGYTCLVVCPSLVPTAPGHRVKNNRLDSAKIATALRGGQLKSIQVPSLTYRHLRHLVQLRDVAVRQTTAFKSRIKALLLYEGLTFPHPDERWSKTVLGRLEKLPCEPAVRFKLDQLIASLRFHQQQAVHVQREIRRFCQNDSGLTRMIRLVMSLPGLGWITASHLVARLGDQSSLQRAEQLPAFLGLVPREDSTGLTISRGPITRAGDPHLRSKFIQAAWTAIRRDPEMREFYRRIYQRHPRDHAPQKAIVAVAHKLALRAYAVLRDQRPYVIRTDVRSVDLTAQETPGRGERLDVVAEPTS